MRRALFANFAMSVTAAALTLSGCSWQKKPEWTAPTTEAEADQVRYKYAGINVENPDVETPVDFDTASTVGPVSIEAENREYWDLRLEEAVELALQNSKVLRDLGGLILRTPATLRTVQDPAIQETDPRFGVEAALSAFDAQLTTSLFHEKNDRALNNTFFGGGTRQFQQDTSVFQAGLSKRSALGTTYSVKNYTNYDANNAPGNAVPSAWTTWMDMEVRHPLLFGGGADFNRIAGPTNTPGVFNGVLVARINTDVNLADFEIGVRNYVSDVENAYWDLYYAYRDLDAKINARDAALETWRRVSPQVAAGRLGAEQESLAREQYFRLQEDVQNALTGKLLEGTHTNNGSSGGTFRGTAGVNLAERRLRLLMGIPINDGRTIRPADEPPEAKIVFCWDDILAEALTRRVELRRQKWIVKRRELELEAAKKFLLPTLDAVGRYRWRGLGRDLIQNGQVDPGQVIADDAVSNLTQGQYQEWQLGAEFNMPLGFRRGHAAVRNAELLLSRERVLLREQEREVVLDLSNALADLERAYAVLQTNFNRRIASQEKLEALQAVEGYERDAAKLFLVLDAQRGVAESENTYYRALTEYTLAIKNVHFEKGSILDYNEVFLQEGGWPVKAYEDADERFRLRSQPLENRLEKVLKQPKVVTQGAYMQLVIKEGQMPADPNGVEVPTTDPADMYQQTGPIEPNATLSQPSDEAARSAETEAIESADAEATESAAPEAVNTSGESILENFEAPAASTTAAEAGDAPE